MPIIRTVRPLSSLASTERELVVEYREGSDPELRHRTDGPALVVYRGEFAMEDAVPEAHHPLVHMAWFTNGVLHRHGDMPAYISAGCLQFRQNGVYHRDRGPAFINRDRLEWHQRGKRHRESGPAVVDRSGRQEFWRKGRLKSILENGVMTEPNAKGAVWNEVASDDIKGVDPYLNYAALEITRQYILASRQLRGQAIL